MILIFCNKLVHSLLVSCFDVTEGKVLFEYKQQEPSDHIDPQDVLKALNIANDDSSSKGDGEKKLECDEVVCTVK